MAPRLPPCPAELRGPCPARRRGAAQGRGLGDPRGCEEGEGGDLAPPSEVGPSSGCSGGVPQARERGRSPSPACGKGSRQPSRPGSRTPPPRPRHRLPREVTRGQTPFLHALGMATLSPAPRCRRGVGCAPHAEQLPFPAPSAPSPREGFSQLPLVAARGVTKGHHGVVPAYPRPRLARRRPCAARAGASPPRASSRAATSCHRPLFRPRKTTLRHPATRSRGKSCCLLRPAAVPSRPPELPRERGTLGSQPPHTPEGDVSPPPAVGIPRSVVPRASGRDAGTRTPLCWANSSLSADLPRA